MSGLLHYTIRMGCFAHWYEWQEDCWGFRMGSWTAYSMWTLPENDTSFFFLSSLIIILFYSRFIVLMSLSLFVCHYYPCWHSFVAQSAEVTHVQDRCWFFSQCGVSGPDTSLLSGRRGTFVLVVGSNDSTDRALPHKRISKEQENKGRFQLRREETAQPFFKVFISRGLNKITKKMRQTPFWISRLFCLCLSSLNKVK